MPRKAREQGFAGLLFCWRKESRSARRRGTQEALGDRTRLLEFGRRHTCLSAVYYIEHAFYIVYKGITKHRRIRLPAISCFCYPRCERRGVCLRHQLSDIRLTSRRGCSACNEGILTSPFGKSVNTPPRRTSNLSGLRGCRKKHPTELSEQSTREAPCSQGA